MKLVSEGIMGFRLDRCDEGANESLPNRGAPDVQAIVKAAHEELRRLIQQRAQIMKRIGTIKQTIVGLSNLFSDDELSDDSLELVNPEAGVRRRGLTQACRTVLMEACCPVNTREVSEQVQQRTMPGLCRKNLLASVSVVLNRLVQYGEARKVLCDNGSRAWLWVSDSGDRSPHPAKSAETLVSQP
jgi:hypothetical protein